MKIIGKIKNIFSEGAPRPTAGDEPREFTSRGEGGRVPPFIEKLHGNLANRATATSLMALLTIGGVLLAGNLPAIGALLLALAGIPAVLVLLSWGFSWFCFYGILSIGINCYMIGKISTMFLLPLLFFPAGVLVWAIKRIDQPLLAIGMTLVITTLVSNLLWGISPLFGQIGKDLWGIESQFLSQGRVVLQQIKDLEKQKGMDSEQLALYVEHFRSWIDYVSLLIPFTFIFLWHLVSLGIFYFGATLAAPRLGFYIKPLPSFQSWNFSWNIVWLLFIGWFMFYGSNQLEPSVVSSLVKTSGANFLAISKILFFLAGLSLMFFFFDYYKLNSPLRIGFSVIAILFHQLPVWLGILDIWMDFRRKPVWPGKSEDDEAFF